MKRITILFAHPRYEKSRVNRTLLRALAESASVKIHDLYEMYPDFNIDIEQEKELLLNSDVIIWHHPLYMYSAPAIVKQWIDLVLEFGWAHGIGGDFLKDKIAFSVITSGGTRETYQKDGFNRFTIREFLYPFEQTAQLCKMIYLPPFAVQGTYRLTDAELERHAADFRMLLEYISQDLFSVEELQKFSFLNDWIIKKSANQEP